MRFACTRVATPVVKVRRNRGWDFEGESFLGAAEVRKREETNRTGL